MTDQTAADVVPTDLPSSDGHSDISAVDLRALFRQDASAGERTKSLTAFAATLQGRLRDLASADGDTADVVAERSGHLLGEIVDRLPIRTADELCDAYGPDPDARADRVIDDAAKLARWLWTAAHAIPASPTVVHAAKAVLHCAIEIRMVGELHEARRDPAVDEAATPLPAVLRTWLQGSTVALDWSVSSTVALVSRVRRALADFRGNDGRIRGLVNRGKEGGELIRRLGDELNRSLRAA